MKRISDKEIRKTILKSFRKFNFQNKDMSSTMKLTQLDSFTETMELRKIDSNKEIVTMVNPELSTAYLISVAAGVLAFGFTNRKYKNIIPIEQFNNPYCPNPNDVIGTIFTLLANHILAVINLIENGLEWSARPIVRTVSELCMLLIVILSDPKKFVIYYSPENEQEERDNWHKYFSPKKLFKSLREIEKNLNIKDSDFELFRELVKNSHEFFSQTTHTTSIVSLVGAYSSSIKDDWLGYNLWGRASGASEGTLIKMCNIVIFTFEMFLIVLEKVYNCNLFKGNEDFKFFECLNETILSCILYNIEDEVHSN